MHTVKSCFLSINVTDHIYEQKESFIDKWDYTKLKLYFVDRAKISNKDNIQWTLQFPVFGGIILLFIIWVLIFFPSYGVASTSSYSVVYACVCIFSSRHFYQAKTVSVSHCSYLDSYVQTVSHLLWVNFEQCVFFPLITELYSVCSLHFQDINCLPVTCKCFLWRMTFLRHTVFSSSVMTFTLKKKSQFSHFVFPVFSLSQNLCPLQCSAFFSGS